MLQKCLFCMIISHEMYYFLGKECGIGLCNTRLVAWKRDDISLIDLILFINYLFKKYIYIFYQINTFPTINTFIISFSVPIIFNSL